MQHWALWVLVIFDVLLGISVMFSDVKRKLYSDLVYSVSFLLVTAVGISELLN
jgi:ABC-type uncharacterized transport system involved in gliding motility auxiliary subunit